MVILWVVSVGKKFWTQTATEFFESFEMEKKWRMGFYNENYKWRNKTLTDTSSSSIRQLRCRRCRLQLRSAPSRHEVRGTFGLRRKLWVALWRADEGVACWEGVVRWRILRHHFWLERGSIQSSRHLVRLIVIEVAQIGIQGCLILKVLGEVCARAGWILGGLLLGRNMSRIELRADDFDALDNLLDAVWVLVWGLGWEPRGLGWEPRGLG